jgi:hypothetical protein
MKIRTLLFILKTFTKSQGMAKEDFHGNRIPFNHALPEGKS